jgi:asparagine synthase (glutamine-hydrolysing)
MMHLDFAGYLVDDTQVKLDRASMAVGLEMRCPLLDQALIEFAWSLPLELRAGPDGSKPLLRHALERHLPCALFERPKRGFGVPVASWLRDPLRHWGEDLLGEARLRREGHFQPAAVRILWQQHQEGWQNHQEVLWHILMFQTWHEAWSRPSETRSAPLTDEVSMTAGPEASGHAAAS